MAKKKLLNKKGKNKDDVEIDAELEGDKSSEKETKVNKKNKKGKENKKNKENNEDSEDSEKKRFKLNINDENRGKYKKIGIILAIILVVALIILVYSLIKKKQASEFEDVNAAGQITADSGKPIETYFKYKGNTLYEYTQKNGSSANKSVFVAYNDFDTVQYSMYSNSMGSEWYNQVYEVKDGELRCTIYDIKYKQNVDLLDYDAEEVPIVVLKEPIVLDNTWKIGDGEAEATITKIDYDVKTPNGLYKTVEVTTDYKNGSYKKDYYSETMGLVRTITTSNDGVVTDVELTDTISLSGGLDRAMYVYYLKNDTYDDAPILVQYQQPTNKQVKDVFAEILSESTDPNYKPLISPYTKINFIKLDKDLKMVHVDLSKEFLEYTSKNKNTETKHLNALANTFCRYYQVLNMKLTIDGQPYSSANYKMGENDTIRATFR